MRGGKNPIILKKKTTTILLQHKKLWRPDRSNRKTFEEKKLKEVRISNYISRYHPIFKN